ncbi:hypothetical protein AB0K51_09300 [Kitasatospora sp. NPDC049285]|uniref:hypothetical protein n=1 Tax=Kitasatospora sp. NPDC049285 TaxID=3157096 RepID=UPI0034221C72
MGGRLAAAVHIEHPVSHERLVLEPGTEPEAEVAALITNPAAWEGGQPPEPEGDGDAEPEREEEPEAEPESEPEPEPEQEPEPEPESEPEPARRSRKPRTTA